MSISATVYLQLQDAKVRQRAQEQLTQEFESVFTFATLDPVTERWCRRWGLNELDEPSPVDFVATILAERPTEFASPGILLSRVDSSVLSVLRAVRWIHRYLQVMEVNQEAQVTAPSLDAQHDLICSAWLGRPASTSQRARPSGISAFWRPQPLC